MYCWPLDQPKSNVHSPLSFVLDSPPSKDNTVQTHFNTIVGVHETAAVLLPKRITQYHLILYIFKLNTRNLTQINTQILKMLYPVFVNVHMWTFIY